MKILFVHPSVELYGADKILLYILEMLVNDNNITVLLPKDGILVKKIKEISHSINVIIREDLPIVHSKVGIKKIIQLPLVVKKFNKLFEKNSFDYVYCNTLATVALLYTKWSRNRIIHIHEIIENNILNTGFSFLVWLGAKKVICVSDHVKRRLLFSKKYMVIHNGIPDLNKENQFIKHEVNNNKNKITFVLPGRFMPKKGQWFLIEALKTIPKEELKLCDFLLYGSAPPNRLELENGLRSLVYENELNDIVTLCPFNSDIVNIYKNADVVLVPSLMPDPFPTTVLEAMMFGKPIITTNNGGASEIVDNTIGFLINPNDVEAFSKALKFFIKEMDAIQQYGINARKKYADYLTIDCFKERLSHMFVEDCK